MDTQDPTKTNNEPISELSERMARIETKMDFMATHKDVEGVRTEVASMKGELLTEIAGIRTLVANRDASMQRWLLGVTVTMVVALTAALLRTVA